MTKKWELLIIERSGKVRYWGNREIAEMTHEQYLQTCYQAHSEAPAGAGVERRQARGEIRGIGRHAERQGLDGRQHQDHR